MLFFVLVNISQFQLFNCVFYPHHQLDISRFFILNFQVFQNMKMVSYYCFSFYFSVDEWCWVSFHIFMGNWHSFFNEHTSILPMFFSYIIIFLLFLMISKSFCILRKLPLFWNRFCKDYLSFDFAYEIFWYSSNFT